jgi:hypothetical protein
MDAIARRQHDAPARVLPHIKRLNNALGDFLLRVSCPCGASRHIEPEGLARIAGRSVTLAQLGARMRCSRCGKNVAEVVAVAHPRPRGGGVLNWRLRPNCPCEVYSLIKSACIHFALQLDAQIRASVVAIALHDFREYAPPPRPQDGLRAAFGSPSLWCRREARKSQWGQPAKQREINDALNSLRPTSPCRRASHVAYTARMTTPIRWRLRVLVGADRRAVEPDRRDPRSSRSSRAGHRCSAKCTPPVNLLGGR